MKKTVYSEFLGVKLSKEETRALENVAKNNGLDKSTYARSVLHNHLVSAGAIKIIKLKPSRVTKK